MRAGVMNRSADSARELARPRGFRARVFERVLGREHRIPQQPPPRRAHGSLRDREPIAAPVVTANLQHQPSLQARQPGMIALARARRPGAFWRQQPAQRLSVRVASTANDLAYLAWPASSGSQLSGPRSYIYVRTARPG